MSLVECDVEIEEGSYKDFNFMLRLLYDKETHQFKGGTVLLREKQHKINPIKLLIEPSKPDLIDFSSLYLAAAENNYEIRDLEGLKSEIIRKCNLINILRSPDSQLLPLKLLLKNYPELKLLKYRERLPEYGRRKLEKYLTKSSI